MKLNCQGLTTLTKSAQVHHGGGLNKYFLRRTCSVQITEEIE
jgi:hypothetical protein